MAFMVLVLPVGNVWPHRSCGAGPRSWSTDVSWDSETYLHAGHRTHTRPMADDPRRELADFLKARRTRLRPQDVGLEPGPRRRVAGLRREEIALLGELATLPRPARNMLWLLLQPGADLTCPDRAATVGELTAMLRTAVAADPGHPRALELVGELAVHSAEFRTLWGRHDIEETT